MRDDFRGPRFTRLGPINQDDLLRLQAALRLVGRVLVILM